MSRVDDFLSGVTVLELGSGNALAYAGLLLADAGARVIKLEPVGGDPARRSQALDGATGSCFEYLNRGKLSVCLNWQDGRAASALQRLGQQVDALAHFVVGDDSTMYQERLGAHKPQHVVECAVSAFGENGPLAGKPGAEVVIQGMANYFGSLGQIGMPPVRVGADLAELNTGVFAALAVVTGLVARLDSGLGERASCSMLGSLIHLRSIVWGAMSNPDDWVGFHIEGETWPPDEGTKTADGRLWFNLHRSTSEDWDRLLIELDMLDVQDDPHFANFGREATGTGRHAPMTKPRWEAAFATRGTAELLALLGELGANAAPVNDYGQLLAHSHARARGMGEARLASGHPAILSPWMIEGTIAEDALAQHLAVPAAGQHTELVLKSAGLSDGEVAALRRDGLIN